jgi:hypothetical protein
MRTTNPYEFIQVGLLLRFLRHSQAATVEILIKGVRDLVWSLERIDFQVSLSGTQNLKQIALGLEKETDKSRVLAAQEYAQVAEYTGDVEKMIFAEATTKRLHLISDSRFNLDALLNKPSTMFAAGVFARLPAVAKQDVTSGFQCLAFDQPTAVAFHLLRACEAVLKLYYFQSVKRKRLKTPMWGNMLDHLRTKRDSDNKLLDRLAYIKDNFRNPTSHPEAIYTLSEAQDLIGICIDVINRMGPKLEEPLLKSA